MLELKFRTRRIMGWLVVASLLTLPSFATAEDESSSVAPDFTAKGIDGTEYRLADLLEKGPVFLDFWTTWCKPCQIALPKLAELHGKYADQGFTLLTVASDDQRTVSKVKPLIKSRKWTFPVVSDPKRTIGNKYSVRNYPTSYLISQDGKIHSVHVGYRPGDEKTIEKEIVALLPQKTDTEAAPVEGGSN